MRADGMRFVDPRPQASMVPTPARWSYGMGEHIRVAAVPGLFVLFPAWLQHYVVPHAGGGTRMSVSFNVRVTYPPENEADESFVGGAGGGATAAPKLSFVVPSAHEAAFRDPKLAKDMLATETPRK